MNLQELDKLMPVYLDTPNLSLELLSSPGLGKSEFVESTVEKMSKRDGEEWGFATAFLATYTPPDLIGYQFKGERNWDGKVVSVTDPTVPLWMVTRHGKPVWAYKRGILFLDEFGQAETDVKRSAAELLLNQRIGQWELPRGWTVIAASNRSEDRSGVTKSLDFVINRRLEINITPSVDAWLDWAAVNGVSPIGMAFAKQHPHLVFDGKVPDKQGPWCTPRSLVKADRLFQNFDKAGLLDDRRFGPIGESLKGLVGEGVAAQFHSFLKLEREMPKWEDIISKPTKCKVPEKPDAQMLICYNLAHRVSVDTVDPVIQYINLLPKEFAVTFATAACRRDMKLVASAPMQKWAQANSSLMAAISR